MVVIMDILFFNYVLNYSIGFDGLSILFIILSTSYCDLYLSSESINIDENYFLFVIFN